jgi:peptidoglycan-associated lipoprotein
MHKKTISALMGSLSLLVAAGAAWGGQPEAAGAAAGSSSASAPVCRDAGITVAFKTGSAELDQNARGGLDGVATWLKGDPTRVMHLEGFADPSGDPASNLTLSAERAEAVKNYLVEKGVDPSRVATIGKGEETEHLPANGRAVTFLACQAQSSAPSSAPMAEEQAPEPAPAPPEEVMAPPPPAPVAAAPPPAPVPASSPWGGFGWALMAGGGYQDFTSTEMRAVTSGGGAWDARFIAGTNSVIAFEAAYVGASRQMSALGDTGANNPLLVANGLEGTLRLNAPIRRGASLFEPYVYGGIGYAHYGITNYNSNTQVLSSFTSNDDVTTVPVGGGFAFAYKAFIADARAGWTGTYNQDLLISGASSNTLNHWNVGGEVGLRF